MKMMIFSANFRLKIPLGVGNQSEWEKVGWMPESCYKTIC
nr:MAG TPA: hypothetical protein [Caudoviricetes sp.]